MYILEITRYYPLVILQLFVVVETTIFSICSEQDYVPHQTQYPRQDQWNPINFRLHLRRFSWGRQFETREAPHSDLISMETPVCRCGHKAQRRPKNAGRDFLPVCTRQQHRERANCN
jgi:hypothetical protein